MKKLITLLSLVFCIAIYAQAPAGFSYQATVRNNSGVLIIKQSVSFKFSIKQNFVSGTVVYNETQTTTTDDLGQVSLTIGKGTATTGTFAGINWGSGTYFLGIEINTGIGYVAMGTTQLMSVPYALYAQSSGNAASTPNLASVLAVNNSANNLQIKNLQNPTDTQDAVTKGYLDTAIEQLQSQLTALQYVSPIQGVTIGTQVWSSTNYDGTTYRDGTPIPHVTNTTEWANLTTGAWCYYLENSANGVVYGKLYNWYAVAGVYDAASFTDPSLRKQFAPTGWHVPTANEMIALTNYLGIGINVGGNLKESGTSHWEIPNTDATNSSGFTALPGGARNDKGMFTNINKMGYWWTTFPDTKFRAWYLYLQYTSGVAGLANGDQLDPVKHMKSGFSVRFLKD